MKRLVFVILLLFFVWANLSVHAQQADYRIIPQPKEVTVDSLHVFTVYEGMSIAYDEAQADVARNAGFLQQWIEQATGLRLELRPSDKHAAIRMQLIRKGSVKKGRRVDFPFVQIVDQPRFAYRGVLLDCARHFFDVSTIKQFLDAMALHGCNQFHWHLTDDQGWRFEVKALPELAKQGSVREQTVIGPGNMGIYDGVPYGGYYTQDDCREVVRYAAERYINVVPEIDLPGHMQGALHVFPQLGCTGGPYPVLTYWTISRDVLCGGNPETIRFLPAATNVLKTDGASARNARQRSGSWDLLTMASIVLKTNCRRTSTTRWKNSCRRVGVTSLVGMKYWTAVLLNALSSCRGKV